VVRRAHRLVEAVGPQRVCLGFRGGYQAYAEGGGQALGGVTVRGGKVEGREQVEIVMQAKRVTLERVVVRNVEGTGGSLCEELTMNKCVKNRLEIVKMVKRLDKIKKLTLLKPDKYLMVMILRDLKIDNITDFTFEGRYDRDYIFMWFLNLSLISKMPTLAHLSLTFPLGEPRLMMKLKLSHLFNQLPLSHRLTTLTFNLPYN
jgi:hypothetical protein